MNGVVKNLPQIKFRATEEFDSAITNIFLTQKVSKVLGWTQLGKLLIESEGLTRAAILGQVPGVTREMIIEAIGDAVYRVVGKNDPNLQDPNQAKLQPQMLGEEPGKVPKKKHRKTG
jgi:hypothetical protein